MSTDPQEEVTSPAEVEIDLEQGLDEADSSTDEIEINLDFGDFSEPDEADAGLDLGRFAEPAEDDSDEESDQALEKALEELRVELRSKPGDWYVVHTYSGM